MNVFIHLAEGFEEIEAIAPIDILRRAGCNVVVISVTGNITVTGAHNIKVVADIKFEDADYSQADMLVLPGGMPGSANLDKHAGLCAELTKAANNGKWLAAICAAPMVLGHLGLLKGKNVTCYPGFESELLNANHTGKPVEMDGKIITANGPGAAMAFGYKLVEVLVGIETANDWKTKMMA